MLQQIHDKAKGWVAYAIVGFIAIPFTLFGISSYLGGSNSLVAAKVNGEEIPVQLVQNSVVQQRQRLIQMFGGKLPPGFNDENIKRQAVEQAIIDVLLRQEAEKYGYRASNQEVYDEISEIPAFQKGGVFDVATYEKLLAAQRRNKSTFEADVRRSITNQQFTQALNDAAFLPKTELSRYQQLQNQTRSAETYTLKKSAIESQVKVTDDEVKAYYGANATQFMTPEKVRLGYIELKQSDLAKSVDVNDEVLQNFYDENLGRYSDPEQRKVSHILVKSDNEKDGEDADKKAADKIKSLYEQITSGAKTFVELASNNSDDDVSAKKSGEIGLIARGDMGPLFEKEAFLLAKGEMSKPVKTEAGYEIIKVLDVIESKQKPFNEVKKDVEKAYRAEQAEKLFFDESEKMQTLAFENDSTLDTAADAVGLKVKTSDWINRGAKPAVDKGVLASPKLLSAAFSDDVLKQGKNSELLEIDSQTVALIRLQDHKDPEQRPLADVKDEIKTILKNQKLRKILIEKGESVLAKLRETGSWADALKLIGESPDKVEKITALKRTDPKYPKVLIEKIFSMPKPQKGKQSYDNVILPEGEYVVIALLSVKDGEVKEDKISQTGFTQAIGSREQQALLKSLREKADVKLFIENIQ